MFNKLKWLGRLYLLIMEMIRINARVKKINNMVYPIGDIPRIKAYTPYYDEYVQCTERLYEIMSEEAYYILKLRDYEHYETMVSYLKIFEPLVWNVKLGV